MRTNLLPALFDTAEPLQSIIRRFDIDIHELLDYFDDHTNLAHFQRIAELTNRRTRMLLANLKLKALAVLDRVVSGDPDVTEPERKAATQLLRTREEHLAIPIDDLSDAATTTPTTPADESLDERLDEPVDTSAATTPLAPVDDQPALSHANAEPLALRITTDAPETPRYPVAPTARRASAGSGTRGPTRFKKRKR